MGKYIVHEYKVYEAITKKEYAQVLVNCMLKTSTYPTVQLMSEGEEMIYQLKRTDTEKPTVEQVLEAPWDKAARAKVIGSDGNPESRNESTAHSLWAVLQALGVFA